MHGIKLEQMLNELVDEYGWRDMSARIRINCFSKDPSVKSSLKFLRKTPWARYKVENLYRYYRGFPEVKPPEKSKE